MNTNKSQAKQLPQDAVMQSVLAKDLRLGNKLLFLGDVVTFKNITEIREDGIFWIKTFEPKIESKNFHFKPIPITEDWLLKFGFELKGFYRLKVTSFLELCWKPHDNTLNLQTEKNGFTENSKCKYVHELQNLYFALTGRELTVA